MEIKETFNDIYQCSHSSLLPFEQKKLHLHNHFELFLFIKGDVQYFVANKSYLLESGDLLIFNSNELHGPKFLSNEIYERICVHISPHFIKELSSDSTNLLNCFLNRAHGENNLIKLEPPFYKQFKDKASSLCQLDLSDSHFGKDLEIQSLITQLLIMTNQAFLSMSSQKQASLISPLVSQIINYVDAHLKDELSLAILEKELNINRFHLNKTFKKEVGTSLYQYIILNRVAKAKKLLQQGFNVAETCEGSGFNDYANFIRTFKKTTGFSPTNYLKQNI